MEGASAITDSTIRARISLEIGAMETIDAAIHPERCRMIDAELLLQEIGSGRRLIVVDVRDPAEFRGPNGRIPGARSFPLTQLPSRRTELDDHRSDRIVVVSSRGVRACAAAEELEVAGFCEVQVLAGGMRRWLELGYPVAHATYPPFGPAAMRAVR